MTFRLIKVVCSHGTFFLIIVNSVISEGFSVKNIYILYKEMMGKKSTYRFHNCKVYYGIEEPIGNNDVPGNGFFLYNKVGANLLISGSYDCYTSFNVPDNITSHNGTVVD